MAKNKKMVLSAMFLAIAYVLPFVTGYVPKIGNMLCPMHLPVMIAGFVCGWQYGLLIGVIAPLFRSLTLGMPVLFPSAVCMSVELATYGVVCGLLYRFLPKKKWLLYVELVIAMIVGRLTWGASQVLALSVSGGAFTFALFITKGFVNAIPGIILQIIAVPPIVMVVEKIEKLRDKND